MFIEENSMAGSQDGMGLLADEPIGLLSVFRLLSQKDLITASEVCQEWLRVARHPSLWKVLNLRGMNKAGERLQAALRLPMFKDLQEVNFEFAQGLEDRHLKLLAGKELDAVNLNACQQITDEGLRGLVSAHPTIMSLSLYWNLKTTDQALVSISDSCPSVTLLNFSGCKHISDVGIEALARRCHRIRSLDLTRCFRVTDAGLGTILDANPGLEELRLYADSNFTDSAFLHVRHLAGLSVLDICGMQHLTDEGLKAIAHCSQLTELNLTWCIQVTDFGVCSVAENCQKLQSLSLYGLLGVTDASLDALEKSCSQSLTTLDVNGCANIKNRSREELLQRFPRVSNFHVHS